MLDLQLVVSLWHNFSPAMTTTEQILHEIQLLKAQMAEISRRSAHTKETLTFTEAAGYIGCSKSYLYKLTSTGRIAFFKPAGKKIYFTTAALDDFLQRGANKAIDMAAVKMAAADLITYRGRRRHQQVETATAINNQH